MDGVGPGGGDGVACGVVQRVGRVLTTGQPAQGGPFLLVEPEQTGDVAQEVDRGVVVVAGLEAVEGASAVAEEFVDLVLGEAGGASAWAGGALEAVVLGSYECAPVLEEFLQCVPVQWYPPTRC